MPSVISQVFSCCLDRRRPEKFDRLDEESRLIPPRNEYPSPLLQHGVSRSQKRYNERMNKIVRSKEGKMVNLSSPFPFSISNKSLSPSYGSTSPCRSVSRPSNSQVSNTLPVHSALHAHIGASLGPVLHPSVSRSLSSASPETILNHDGAFSRPSVFNLRLVRSPKQASRAAARRGRARIKPGGDDEADLLAKSTEASALKPSTDISDLKPVSAASSVQEEPHHSSRPPIPPQSFVFQDAGPLSVSWSD